MKPVVKNIALERMEILLDNAVCNAKTNPKLPQRTASLEQKINTNNM